MDVAEKIDSGYQEDDGNYHPTSGDSYNQAKQQLTQKAIPSQNQQPLKKRKHRRGRAKAKNNKQPYRKTNWKFRVPPKNYNNRPHPGENRREKYVRSDSLVPYNTNKFLMEEHLAEVPSALLTPSGRTRDSSISIDSEDNYFFPLPEDEEEFLTKEFANVYEKARIERLEGMNKQELIQECLQLEDRYSTKQEGTQRQQQMHIQRITGEYMAKIRSLEEKSLELSRENYNLRCQLMRSAAMSAAIASPPSASAPTDSACAQIPMDSSSEDSESDSDSSTSSSSSSTSSSSAIRSRSSFGSNHSHSCNSNDNQISNCDDESSPAMRLLNDDNDDEEHKDYDNNINNSIISGQLIENCEQIPDDDC